MDTSVDEVNRAIAADRAVQRKIKGLSEADATALAQSDIASAKAESKRFNNVLKKEGIDASNVKKIVEFAKLEVIGSSILYKHVNFDTFLIYISGGPYGIAYADFVQRFAPEQGNGPGTAPRASKLAPAAEPVSAAINTTLRTVMLAILHHRREIRRQTEKNKLQPNSVGRKQSTRLLIFKTDRVIIYD